MCGADSPTVNYDTNGSDAATDSNLLSASYSDEAGEVTCPRCLIESGHRGPMIRRDEPAETPTSPSPCLEVDALRRSIKLPRKPTHRPARADNHRHHQRLNRRIPINDYGGG